jgi:hypothetical protein
MLDAKVNQPDPARRRHDDDQSVASAADRSASASGAQEWHLLQARLPVRLYEWLRTRWYVRQVPMNSEVVAAVAALRAGTVLPRATAALAEQADQGAGGQQRFTVRLPAADYEWLRAEAFRDHVSINSLLCSALAAYSEQQGAEVASQGLPERETAPGR